MGFVQSLKDVVYDVIIWSGIVNLLMPIFKPFMVKFVVNKDKNVNYKCIDDGGHVIGLTVVGEKLYPPITKDKILSIPYFKVRNDDVLLCGYPKTGCHWMYEILHMLVNRDVKLTTYGKGLGGMIDLIPDLILDSLPSPRVLNSHLLYDDLPRDIKKARTKIIFTNRNPKDTVVSFYNHHKNFKMMYDYNGDFHDYFKLFIKGELEYGSYFDYLLSWDATIKNQRENQILVVEYEDVKSNPVKCIIQVAEFLEIAISEQFAEEIKQACDFSKMKAVRTDITSADGKLFRKGEVGDWKNWLTLAESKMIETIWEQKMSKCFYQPKF